MKLKIYKADEGKIVTADGAGWTDNLYDGVEVQSELLDELIEQRRIKRQRLRQYEEGHYWISNEWRGEHKGWRIIHFDGRNWWSGGGTCNMDNLHIGPRIEEPPVDWKHEDEK